MKKRQHNIKTNMDIDKNKDIDKKHNHKKNRKPWLGYIIVGFIYLLACTLIVVCKWSKKEFGLNIDKIVFTLLSPLKGADMSVVENGIRACVPPIIANFIPYILIVVFDCWLNVSFNIKCKIKGKNIKLNVVKLARIGALFIVCLFLFKSVAYAEESYEIIDYLKAYNDATTIYEDYYVNPNDVEIKADGDEKNLIYIYLESMETTYMSDEVGGQQGDNNYIPNLTKLAQNNVSFSEDDKLGGFLNTVGTDWTVASLIATSSGIPYRFPTRRNEMKERKNVASGVTSLGEILEDKGYYQEFMCGSDGDFGGRKTYYQQHGNYDVFDLYTAREKGYIPEDYFVWWGFEDSKLFTYAKDELKRISKMDKPFNFTMLTVDCHYHNGYKCKLCPDTYDNKTANILVCTDRLVKDFIDWCKKQDFYKDTVIIITGDHPRMDKMLVDGIDIKERSTYNCFLNVDDKGVKTEDRTFTPMDMFPTTLGAMGFEIENDRLGLGTNLFSDKPTLAEEMGFDKLNEELSKKSKYYLKTFS